MGVIKISTQRTNPFDRIYARLNSPQITKAKELLCLDIELTNHCNFKCLMCPCGTGVMRREKGFMKKSVYNKIIKEIAGRDIALRFIRWGEPFLHKDIIKYIEAAKKEGIKCHINTNASLLTDDISKKLIALKLDSIKLSFQGVNEQSYSQMRINGCFNKIIESISRLNKLRGDNEYPYIHAATTTTYETDEQIKDFRHKLKTICDYVTTGKTKLEHIKTDETNLSNDEKAVLDDLKTKQSLVKKRFKTCPEVFGKLSINWNGDVSACCMDYDNKMILGNADKTSLWEIWDSALLNNYRRILNAREYHKLELCKHCYDYMNIQA